MADHDHCDGSSDCGAAKTDTKQHGAGEKQHDVDGRVCTLKGHEKPPDFHDTACDCGCGPWYESSVTLRNVGTCTRWFQIGVTGEINPNSCDHSELGSSSVQSGSLAAGEKQTFWFTGSIKRMEMEPGDFNVGISQRSQKHSTNSECNRGYDG